MFCCLIQIENVRSFYSAGQVLKRIRMLTFLDSKQNKTEFKIGQEFVLFSFCVIPLV